MRYSRIPTTLFEKNREKIFAKLPASSSAIIFANPQMPRNGDLFFPYRQNSDLFYVTGITQEKSIVILTNYKSENKAILFILNPRPELEQWEGKKLRIEEAKEISGIAEIHYVEEFQDIWEEIACNSDHLYYGQNCNPRLKTELNLPDKIFGEQLQSKWTNKDVACLSPILTACRIVKEPEEIELIKKACSITSEAFYEIAKATRAGMYEYELEAIMSNVFLRNGANGHAFDPIIANGRNTCYLHYVKNDQILQDGNLILMDFGSEYANYSSDCTRVFPVNGTFTKRQKEIHTAVYKVFTTIKNEIAPGKTISELQKLTCRLIQEELLSLGILSKQDIEVRGEHPAYFKYYMHGVSHFIGLDTHDVGEKDEILKPGMVLSCEPGIYTFDEEIGIRLEDTMLVTQEGCQDLMDNLPMSAEEIEELMNS
ncbi:MAG: aminopeptidase P N-terminal domain-containing protein [Bacteroidales bacterium]|nr:aminopeptidase P N-terminal domain-containing protein [Bacteroidales bacterium]